LRANVIPMPALRWQALTSPCIPAILHSKNFLTRLTL
jgi:hypothetical protein